MLVVGLLVAVGVEWVAVHMINRWTYTAQMPRIPGLEIGLVPIAQMLIQPPLIFRFVSAALSARAIWEMSEERTGRREPRASSNTRRHHRSKWKL